MTEDQKVNRTSNLFRWSVQLSGVIIIHPSRCQKKGSEEQQILSEYFLRKNISSATSEMHELKSGFSSAKAVDQEGCQTFTSGHKSTRSYSKAMTSLNIIVFPD